MSLPAIFGLSGNIALWPGAASTSAERRSPGHARTATAFGRPMTLFDSAVDVSFGD